MFFGGACWVGVFFWGGWGGWVTHLALSPPCFFVALLLFCYCFVIASFLFHLFGFFLFFGNNIQCLPFFSLACHSLSLYLSLSLSLSISLSLFSLLSFFLPCVLSVSVVFFFAFLVLGFVLLALFLCLCFMNVFLFVSIFLVFHEIIEMSNFKILNSTGFFDKSFLGCDFQRATSPDPSTLNLSIPLQKWVFLLLFQCLPLFLSFFLHSPFSVSLSIFLLLFSCFLPYFFSIRLSLLLSRFLL